MCLGNTVVQKVVARNLYSEESTRRVWCQSPKPEYKSEAQRYGVTSFVSLVSQSAATVCELTGRCAILQPQVCRRAASR
jgi:hypothetical protein